ncbi:hypothetical protein EON76_03255 [bacterium]|nr:MAG: hypothetical protein EON76_03255 [bacterium]
MILAVFGSDTGDGLSFINHATRVGFDLRVLTTTTPACKKRQTKNVTFITGEYNPEDIGRCIKSSDAVIVFADENMNNKSIDTILDVAEDLSVSRLIVCEDLQHHDDYDTLRLLSRKLSQLSVDWTLIKRARHDIAGALHQIDASLAEETHRHKSFASYIINQVTDSRFIGTTVMVTNE